MDFLEFKNKFFDGNEEKALAQLAYESYSEDYELTGNVTSLQETLNTMDRKTANKYMDFLREEIRKDPKKFDKSYKFAQLLHKINMNEEDVIKTEKNPFVKKLWVSVAIIIAGIFAMALLLAIKRIANFESKLFESLVSYGMTIFIGVRSINTAGILMNVFNFRKAKKYIKENFESFANSTSIDEKTEKTQDVATTKNSQNDYEEITRAYCLKELQALYKDRKSMYIVLAIASLLLFGLCSLGSVVWLLPAIICPILCIVLSIKNAKKLKNINSLEFYISTNTCVDKTFKIDSDNNSVYSRKLMFSNGDSYNIHLPHKGISYQLILEEYLYNLVNIGDTCYCLHIGNEKKISLVFPANEFSIAEDEFTNKNDCYYPIKNTDAKNILTNEASKQYEDLSSIQKTAIADAEIAITKAAKGQKAFKIFSAIVVLLTLLGLKSEMLQLFNLFLQPFLFIIPSIPALKGIFKAKTAVDRVDIDYLDYYKLRDKQQAASMSIIILLVDILAYLGNFALIITMRI